VYSYRGHVGKSGDHFLARFWVLRLAYGFRKAYILLTHLLSLTGVPVSPYLLISSATHFHAGLLALRRAMVQRFMSKSGS
jgi:hypothetical protein